MSERLIGGLVICGAGAVAVLGLVVMVPRYLVGELTLTAALLGIALVLVLALPIAGFGVMMLVRGGQTARAAQDSIIMRRVLDAVTTRGQVALNDLAVELQVPRDQLKHWIYRLVGLGVFTGYVNWDDGLLYSTDAAHLRDSTSCKKCGGEVQLAGKGVIRCPYCGTEYFLP